MQILDSKLCGLPHFMVVCSLQGPTPIKYLDNQNSKSEMRKLIKEERYLNQGNMDVVFNMWIAFMDIFNDEIT